ncbi:hypothetical protein NW762_001162 [Fusarium torreyae]|uniref:Uncharacterized protein n=1 Tax=Fusarium torreyae TaxID=1237075 RepID=A0A9W8SC09_9HYPO|nr:hypothetical protein NW762_001162 [Fusarium torreyae]
MSSNTPIRCRTIEDVPLPAPATKLIISQHLEASRDSPYWAWIIIGAFYDRDNNIIWSTEIFAGHLDVDLDSDDESSDSENNSSEVESGRSDTEETDSGSDIYFSDQEGPDDDNNDHALNYQYQEQVSRAQQFYPHWYQNSPYNAPSESWDPTRQGPVPGYWQASFDPHVRRWVHTWQPLC